MKIMIPLIPRTKKNSQRIVRFGNRYAIIQSKRYIDYEKQCYKYMPKIETIKTPVNIKCFFYMDTKRKVDLTNLLEAIDDILVKYKIIEDDNYHIIVGHDFSRVFYCKENPRTEIEIDDIYEDKG